MRNMRARRRFKVLSVFFFLALFVIFFESRVESFAPQIKEMVKIKLEESMNNKLEFGIGELEGGIVRPFVLNNVTIKDSNGKALLGHLKLKTVTSNFRVWDILFKNWIKGPLAGLGSNKPYIYFSFNTRNKEVYGSMRVKGELSNADIKGYMILGNSKKIDFSGVIKSKSFNIEVKPKNGIAVLTGSVTDEGDLLADIKFDKFIINGVEISCEINSKNRIDPGSGATSANVFAGQTHVKDISINRKVLPDLNVLYRIEGDTADIYELDIGGEFKLSGRALLREPYNVNLTFLADNANLGKLLALADNREESLGTGTMNAKIELKGPIRKLQSYTHLEVKKGSIGALDFLFLTAELKGDGPIVRIEDSRITRESGSFKLAGEIDVSKIGKAIMFQGVKLISDEKAIMWDGWNSESIRGINQIDLQKKLNEDMNLGVKKFVLENDKIDESSRDKDEYNIQYKLNTTESLKVQFGDDNDFFGLEHKNKF